MDLTERGMGAVLGLLRRVAGAGVVDRFGLREPLERAVYGATRTGFRAVGSATRRFDAATRRRSGPARQRPTSPTGLFDLTPTDEQRMLQEAFRDFASGRLRPAAADADATGQAPAELLAESLQLGVAVLGVPTELGGVVDERSTVTSVLAAEALASGDLGLAAACLAPGAVATALSLWGDADQQDRYLPAFVGDDPPVAALALLEPRPLFDPGAVRTHAERVGDGYRLTGTKSLVLRGEHAELFLVAADRDGTGPALFLVEASVPGVLVAPEPAMGLRPAATSTLLLDGAEVPAEALLADGAPEVHAECVHRARLAWCALTVGTSQAVLDHVIPYVNERVAFGEPISNRQSVAFAVADIAIELDGMRLATYRAASRADQDAPFAEATTRARQLCARHGMWIGSTGVQLLGGHGYVKEHPVERWYRDLRAAGVMEGALLV